MKITALAVCAGLIVLNACGTAPTPVGPSSRSDVGPSEVDQPPQPPKSLYERLGGQPAIEAVVGEFVARLAADKRVKYRFVNSDIPSLTADLVDFVCMAAGGPCEYTGREMQVLHASMQITEAEWDATVEALVGALEKFNVPEAEMNEVLSAIGSTKVDIVAPPSTTPDADELARIDEASADLSRFGERAEILEVAFIALRAGQKAYADQLFSMVEVWLGADAVADLAPLFRAGAPPRITTPLIQFAKDAAPQPKGAHGNSETEEPPTKKPPKAWLVGRLALPEQQEAFGVVMLTPLKGKYRKRRAKDHVVEQRGREFAPHLMAVPVGSTVLFPNFDNIYHNVFSRSKTRPFDLGIFKNGQARALTFEKEGIVRVGCNLHANMSMSIIVVKAPHYAVTDASGSFRFSRLKPGKYRMEAWTERSSQPTTREIEISPGENRVDVDAVDDVPEGPAPDKFGASRGAGS